jgi:hypothetical protein
LLGTNTLAYSSVKSVTKKKGFIGLSPNFRVSTTQKDVTIEGHPGLIIVWPGANLIKLFTITPLRNKLECFVLDDALQPSTPYKVLH